MKQVASARTEEEQDEEEEERRGGGGTVTRKGMKGDSDNTTTRKAASNNEAAAGMAIQRAKFRKLVEACKRKELCVIRQLLGEHPELLNYHDKFHRNLLHYVSILAPADEKRPMAAQPAPVRGDSLDYGSQQASSSECLDCFRYLASKCDPKLWFQVDQDGLTILHLAVISCNILLVREILFNRTSNYVFKRHQQRMELSSLVTALDKEHHSPLHWAVITNNLECVRLLIEHSGVQLVHQADLNGATPLHYATQTSDYPKYRQQLKQMLKNATSATAAAAHRSSSSPTSASISSSASSCCDGAPNDTTQGSEGARKQTERQTTTTETDSSDKLTTSGPSYNNLDILDFLAHLPGVNLECRDRDSRTALLWAASSGNRQAILLLLQSGANYLCQDANNLGPLHCAASHGFTDCLECLLLLSASSASTSSQINQPDSLNCTPLFYAVLSGNIDCVELLLDRGAKKDWQDVKGRTAAHFGALRGQLNTLKLLEAHGANLWLANKQGDLPLHYAIKSGRQQVVAWLLERSPYERPVNAINNIGRAPIHLAILKGNAPMVDFLIRRGANINQLVKVRDKLGAAPGADGTAPKLALVNPRPEIHHTKSGQSSYHYETALDMARRLNQRECLELLLRNSAKSAANVLASRQTPAGAQSQTAPQPMGGGNVCSLFDLQAADVASPIGFETSGSSAEPPVERPPVPLAASSTGGDRLPRLPARPKPMAEPVPQSSDSANSSALSVSSVTSLRGQKTMATRQHGDGRQSSTIPNNQDQHQANSGQQQQSVQQQADTGTPMRTRRPYRGGINYHNERINASIKCKLYENQTGHQHHHSFPPLNQKGPEARRHGGPSSTTGPGANKYHSAGSLPEQMSTIAGANTTSRSHSGGQQEIITNVNVYTTSPCAQCFHKLALLDEAEPQLHQKCQNCSGVLAADKRGASRAGVATKRSNVETRQATAAAASESTTMDGMISETSDSTDATSETIYDDSEQEELEDEAARGKFLPPLDSGMMMIEGNVAPTGPRVGGQAAMDAQQQQQQARYMASSRSYSQHLPVILSAEEDRSTSGETVVNQAPADQRTRQPQMNEHRVYEPSGSPLSAAGEEPRFDRSQRGRAPIRGHRVMADRYRSGGEPVRSPVAEYIHAPRAPTHNHLPQQQQQRSISEVRTGWIQHQHQQPIRANYSQIRAKVDSHRNDSGLSSHFGDELDGSSTAGRRSKSWSSTFSAPGNQQPAPDHQHLGGHHQFGGAKSPPLGEHRHLASHEHHHHHQQEEPHSRSCSRQTIIKTRRLSVDSEELASTIEKSIRRYKQESKLFEQLQNLKRSQIRSGRANEALLVKRLADHFRQEMLQESPVALEVYRGPYTYQAYELYLYDQLKRISQTNYARLAGARVPHKFTYQQQQQDHQYDDPTQQMMRETEKMHAAGGGGSDAVQEARDFLEEDLRAEQELQRVLNGGGGGGGSMQEDEVNFQESAPELLDTTIAIEPSGALEDIRVRQRQQDTGHEDHVTTIEHSEVRIDLDETEKGRAEELEASSKEAAAADNEQGLGGVVGELEELVAARLEKQARTSSTGSSHRSSVEIELEKLDKLPLRVDKSEEENKASLADDSIEDSGLLPAAALGSLAEEKERKQIESQAIDLTSAIITDALGNVSRAGSPILSRKRSQDDQSVVQRQTSSESVGTQVDQEDMVAQKSETKEEQEEEQEQEQEQATQGRGRRRSVVNIGDKIEIVYHKVGIEIDTVAEADDHSDDEREPTRGAAAAAVQEQRSADSEADVSDQQMREKTNDGQIEAIEDDRAGNEGEDEQSGDQKSEVSQREETGDELPGEIDHSVLQQHTDHEEEQEKAELGEDSGAREMEAPRRKSSSQQSPEMDSLRQQPSAAILRRASSPPAPKLGPNQKSNRYDTALPRRSSSPHHPTADAIITRKIFNGFDLDSLHEHRRLHQQRQLEEKNKADRAEHQGDSVRRVRQARRLQPIRKLTKPRSRLPEGPYRVYVPLELIRRRWNEVKQYERERCKALRLDDLSRSSVDNKTYEPTAGLQVEDRDAAPGISHAKSQPNLLRGTSREDKAERSVETASDTCSNFILIYELNKPSSSSTSSRADTNLTRRKQSSEQSGEQQQQQQRATAKHTNWCQKRVTKIVDVRTLKRTLSLPESLIYSNELLKRFSLLKL